jgi:hypothetical protein
MNRVRAGVGSKQRRTASVDTISIRQRGSSTEFRSVLSRTPRSSEGRDAPMGAVGHYIVTRESSRRGEDDASFEAPWRDVDEARDESSGANKSQTMSEATEAKCDV